MPDETAGPETARLRLIPFAPAHLLALLEGVPQFERSTGLRVADGLRDLYVSGEVSPAWLDRLHAARQTDVWEHGFAVVERASDTVVGSGGFTGPPDDTGVVEIAYGIAPGYQGRGYATEVAAALAAFAVAGGARRLRAHTRPEPNASTRVLAKCGFTRVGEVVVPEDGLVWRWERNG